MGSVNIDVGNARQATDGIVAAVGNIRQTINGITSDVQAAKAGWKGEANAAFLTAAAQWEDEGVRLNRRLDEITQTLESGYGKYTQNESASAGGFRV